MITINNTTKNVSEIMAVDISEITKNIATQTNEDGELYVTGDGIFDNLMETATAHLNAQWNNQRIRGEQYAEVYAQIYIKTLELALNAWINKPKADADTLLTLDNIDKTNAETDLVKEQLEHEKLKEELTKCQTRLTCNEADHEIHKIDLTDAQIENTEENTVHEKLKEEHTKCQTKLACEQYQHELLKEEQTEAQTANILENTKHEKLKEEQTEAQTASIKENTIHEKLKEEQTEAQTSNIKEQTVHEKLKESYTQAQTTNLTEQTVHEKLKEETTKCNTRLICAQADHEVIKEDLTECQAKQACTEATLKEKQLDLMDKQLDLLLQQIQSEKAKADVLAAQAKAYENDYKYKFVKMGLDNWAVGYSVAQDDMGTFPALMTNKGINKGTNELWADIFNKTTQYTTDV